MGHGDFKLLAAIGAWLGWQMLPLVILFSSLVRCHGRSLPSIVAAKRGRHEPIPFGPYLVSGERCSGVASLISLLGFILRNL